MGLPCTVGRWRSCSGIFAEKKTPKPDPSTRLPLGSDTDRARERYEQLRDHYLQGSDSDDETGSAGQRFARFGFVGLLEPEAPRGYVAQIHAAPSRGWGSYDPRDLVLQEVVRLLVGPENSSSVPHGLPHY